MRWPHLKFQVHSSVNSQLTLTLTLSIRLLQVYYSKFMKSGNSTRRGQGQGERGWGESEDEGRVRRGPYWAIKSNNPYQLLLSYVYTTAALYLLTNWTGKTCSHSIWYNRCTHCNNEISISVQLSWLHHDFSFGQNTRFPWTEWEGSVAFSHLRTGSYTSNDIHNTDRHYKQAMSHSYRETTNYTKGNKNVILSFHDSACREAITQLSP